jgi:hypothetical protein
MSFICLAFFRSCRKTKRAELPLDSARFALFSSLAVCDYATARTAKPNPQRHHQNSPAYAMLFI